LSPRTGPGATGRHFRDRGRSRMIGGRTMDQTSASLLDQLRGPDRSAAWPRFVRLYTPLLARWAGRLGVPPADQPDLLQDVFLLLLRACGPSRRSSTTAAAASGRGCTPSS